MPNIDAGHYFLTVLLPIKTEPVEIVVGPHHIVTTPMLALREWIASMPTAHQSPVCVSASNSPFARNTRNHFARLAVIDQPAFNGLVQGDTVLARLCALIRPLLHLKPASPQTDDRLSTPYLFFSADFNCIHGDERDLDSYLETLWVTMEPEIRKLFQYCYHFDGVDSAATFAAFIKRGQIETTMPFHDYWSDEEKKQLPGVLPAFKTGAVVAGLFFVAVFLAALFIHMPILCRIGLILAGIAAALYGLYRLAMFEGNKPFPAAHGADLPGVLKSLYLQNAFTRFAIDNQGADAAVLHTAFKDFLDTHQPGHVAAPTQLPGVIGV